MNITTAIFNLQYLSDFCMDFYVTNMSRSTVRSDKMIYKYIFVGNTVSEILVKN